MVIGDIPFYNNTKKDLLRELSERVNKGTKTFVVTANPVILMQGYRDEKYLSNIHSADYITPDGIGVVKACDWLGKPVAERIAGFDLMGELLQAANNQGWKVYLLGAKEHVVHLAKLNIIKSFPEINIVGCHHGFFHSNQPIIDEIKSLEPDIVFVAMGCPKQETWIQNNLHHFNKGLFIGIGGSFDVYSGETKRAPEFLIKCNLEWLYRIWKRAGKGKIAKSLINFVGVVIQEKMHIKKLNAKMLKKLA